MAERFDGTLSGRRLTLLAALLIAAAVLWGAAIVAGGEVRFPRNAGDRAGPSAVEVLSRATAEEGKGNVAAALSLYREAAALRPGLVDRRSPEFLGGGFETKLKGWLKDLKARRDGGDPKALDDASYLFRRMYGGCG